MMRWPRKLISKTESVKKTVSSEKKFLSVQKLVWKAVPADRFICRYKYVIDVDGFVPFRVNCFVEANFIYSLKVMVGARGFGGCYRVTMSFSRVLFM